MIHSIGEALSPTRAMRLVPALISRRAAHRIALLIVTSLALLECGNAGRSSSPVGRHLPRPGTTPTETIQTCSRKRLSAAVIQRLQNHPLQAATASDRTSIDYASRETEKELSKAQDKTVNLAGRLSRWIVKRAPIVGTWDSKSWHDGVHLHIVPTGGACFVVVFHARGDLQSWTLQRRALFRNGVLLFDRLVEEYAPFEPYRRMYLLNLDGTPRFFGAGAVRDFLFDRSKLSRADLLAELMRMALHRRSGKRSVPAAGRH